MRILFLERRRRMTRLRPNNLMRTFSRDGFLSPIHTRTNTINPLLLNINRRTCNPPRQIHPSNTLISRKHERAPLKRNSPHKTKPSISGISCGSQIDADVLCVEALTKERHVIFPADGCCKGDGDGV